MAIKIDMEKAFDYMEWPFILKIFEIQEFSKKWIGWIKECLSTVSYSILINGSPSGFIQPSRGLRQGDLLSSFLFIIGSEVISHLILREENLNHLEGIKISRGGLSITHLLFADDLILFGKVNHSTTATLAHCINTYTAWSGQKINNKSTIHFSNNTPICSKREVKNFLDFKTCTSKLRYLDLPLFIGP